MKKISLIAVAALIMTACNNDNTTDGPEVSPSETLRIFASINDADLTRASGTSWDQGDEIGVTATVGEVTPESFHPHVNMKYTAQDGGKSVEFTGTQLLFYNYLTLSAYHPYKGTEGTTPGGIADGYLIKTDTGIGKQFEGNNKAIDFLYASKDGIKVADAANVELSFSHKMTMLTFSFVNASAQEGNKMDVSKMVSYGIEGLKMDGSFNTLTGECRADADAESEELRINVQGTVEENKAMPSLIVFPQIPEIKDNTDANATEPPVMIPNKARLNMYIDETGNNSSLQHYYCTLSFGEDGLKPGLHYKFTIHVTKVGMIMGDMTIVGWNEIRNSLAATIDGDIDLPEE